MDTNRLVNLVLSDLSLENLKLQERLEQAINSTDDVDNKVSKVKDVLEKLTVNELTIAKFQSLVKQPESTDATQEGGVKEETAQPVR